MTVPSLYLSSFTPRELKSLEKINPRDLTSELNILRSMLGDYIDLNPLRSRKISSKDRTGYMQTVIFAFQYLGRLVKAYMEADTFTEDFDKEAAAALADAREFLGITHWGETPSSLPPGAGAGVQLTPLSLGGGARGGVQSTPLSLGGGGEVQFTPLSFSSRDPGSGPSTFAQAVAARTHRTAVPICDPPFAPHLPSPLGEGPGVGSNSQPNSPKENKYET